MARITDYDLSDYSVLLGTDRIDASKGALFAKKNNDVQVTIGLAPNQNAVTILIGLGGVGVQTLDYVKGQLVKTMNPTWSRYVAMLAIDADTTEINRTAYLSKTDEWIELKDDIINKKASGDAEWPRAWRPMVSRETLGTLKNAHLQKPGSGRMRLMGKLKIHNSAANTMKAYDERIVSKLESIQAATKHTRYEVYVIGSACGGTCSGGFLEMPALIRHALGVDGISTYGMLFLPDTLSKNGSINAPDEIIGNGFAALKEYDYFCGLSMREGTTEKWYYNADAEHTLLMDDRFGFFTLPYLIGTQTGPSSDSIRQAQETVAEFLISLLGDYTVQAGDGSNFVVDAALSNMGKYQNDHPVDSDGNIPRYESHSKPKVYGAIGFAEYSAPVKVVRSYVVSNACKKAGIVEVSKEEWDRAKNAGFGLDTDVLLPFRGADCLFDAQEGEALAAKIVQPLEEALRNVIFGTNIQINQFKRQNDRRPRYTFDWENVYKNKLYGKTSFIDDMNSIVNNLTSVDAVSDMRQRLVPAYARFYTNVHEFVKEHGPQAFVDLYEGKFLPVDGNYGRGLRDMLINLVHGKLHDGVEYAVTSERDAQTNLDRALKNLIKEVGLFKKLGRHIGINDNRESLVRKWKSAYEAWLNARVNEVYGGFALGENKFLYSDFLTNADLLKDDIQAFGCIISNVASTYRNLGDSMETFESFSNSGDNASEVNLASISTRSYDWIKNQANAQLTGIAGKRIRDHLIDHFFAAGNREKWLSIPDGFVSNTNGNLGLVNRDVAIPARRIFDECITDVVPNTLDVSIGSLFEESAQSDSDYTNIAVDILDKLEKKSKPLFNGEYSTKYVKRSIMYPSSLNNSDSGKKAVAAIRAAAKSKFSDNDSPVDVFGSADTNTIRMYQFATPLEMYKLKDLASWEKIYEQQLKEAGGQYMHANSPSTYAVRENKGISYVERRPWRDYPTPVVYADDPKKIEDLSTGEICREGKRRLEIDNTIARAREIGVLYATQGSMGGTKGYIIKLAAIGEDWNLHIDYVTPRPDGLYNTKEALIADILADRDQGETLASISRNVTLKNARLLSQASEDLEDAWLYATETLYAHVPMYHDLEDYVNRFERFHQEIMEQNREILRQRMPAMFPHLIRSGRVFRDENNAWFFRRGSGKQQFLNLQENRVKRLPPKYRELLGEGMVHAYVYAKLLESDRMTDEIFMEMYHAAVKDYDDLVKLSNNGDFNAAADLDVWDARIDVIQSEFDAVAEKFGINYDEEINSHASSASYQCFQKKMRELHFDDAAEISSFFEFYYTGSKWNN